MNKNAKPFMTQNLKKYIEAIYNLCKYDTNYNEATLEQIKEKCSKVSTLREIFRERIFEPFPTITYIINSLHFHNYLTQIFTDGDHPFLKSLHQAKNKKTHIETKLKQLKASLEILEYSGQDQGVKDLEFAIKIFEAYLQDKDDLIDKLNFFKLLKPFPNNPINFEIARLNPFNHTNLLGEDVNFYIKYIDFFTGINISNELLNRSLKIKIHKIFTLNESDIFTNNEELLVDIKYLLRDTSIITEDTDFNIEQIDIKKLDQIHIKTFFHGRAVFDYNDKNTTHILNRYYEQALDEFISTKISLAKMKNIPFDENIANFLLSSKQTLFEALIKE